MFSKNNAPAPAPKSADPAPRKTTSRTSSGVPSILASDLVITGEIATDGDVQVEGRVNAPAAISPLRRRLRKRRLPKLRLRPPPNNEHACARQSRRAG